MNLKIIFDNFTSGVGVMMSSDSNNNGIRLNEPTFKLTRRTTIRLNLINPIHSQDTFAQQSATTTSTTTTTLVTHHLQSRSNQCPTLRQFSAALDLPHKRNDHQNHQFLKDAHTRGCRCFWTQINQTSAPQLICDPSEYYYRFNDANQPQHRLEDAKEAHLLIATASPSKDHSTSSHPNLTNLTPTISKDHWLPHNATPVTWPTSKKHINHYPFSHNQHRPHQTLQAINSLIAGTGSHRKTESDHPKIHSSTSPGRLQPEQVKPRQPPIGHPAHSGKSNVLESSTGQLTHSLGPGSHKSSTGIPTHTGDSNSRNSPVADLSTHPTLSKSPKPVTGTHREISTPGDNGHSKAISVIAQVDGHSTSITPHPNSVEQDLGPTLARSSDLPHGQAKDDGPFTSVSRDMVSGLANSIKPTAPPNNHAVQSITSFPPNFTLASTTTAANSAQVDSNSAGRNASFAGSQPNGTNLKDQAGSGTDRTRDLSKALGGAFAGIIGLSLILIATILWSRRRQQQRAAQRQPDESIAGLAPESEMSQVAAEAGIGPRVFTGIHTGQAREPMLMSPEDPQTRYSVGGMGLLNKLQGTTTRLQQAGVVTPTDLGLPHSSSLSRHAPEIMEQQIAYSMPNPDNPFNDPSHHSHHITNKTHIAKTREEMEEVDFTKVENSRRESLAMINNPFENEISSGSEDQHLTDSSSTREGNLKRESLGTDLSFGGGTSSGQEEEVRFDIGDNRSGSLNSPSPIGGTESHVGVNGEQAWWGGGAGKHE